MENQNNKKIIIVVGVVVFIGALFFIFKNVSLAPVENGEETSVNKTETEKIKFDPNVPNQTLPLSNTPQDLAWQLFQKYLDYNKNHNLEGVKSVVYRVAPVCNDTKTLIDCEARMGSAYSYGSVLKKEDFVNVWEDGKQIILATNFEIQTSDNIMGRNRAIIYFIKDELGNLKLLSFSPRKGVIIDKGTASEEELSDRIIRYTEDNDEDGIADYQEECLSVKEGETCLPTNPKLRDTDGNGLWDGVEVLINQMK